MLTAFFPSILLIFANLINNSYIKHKHKIFCLVFKYYHGENIYRLPSILLFEFTNNIGIVYIMHKNTYNF